MRPQTFQKSLSRLTDTGFRAFFALCLVFAVLTGLFDPALCLGEIAAVLLLYLYLRAGIAKRKEEVLCYLDGVTSGVDSASRRTMLSSPLPIVLFRPDTDDIIWSNERFLHLTGDRDHLFETKLSSLVPGFPTQWLLDGEHISPEPIPVGDRQYLVFGNLVSTGSKEEHLATTYWVDITEYARIKAAYDGSRPVLAILLLDNYEDLGRGLDEGQRSLLRTVINEHIANWLAPAEGMLCRYDRDHYLFLCDAAHLRDFYKRKFSILDDLRTVLSPNGVAATLSIGIGVGAASPKELYHFASLALDMALSRCGDQVVVKDANDFSFIGGRSKETERRTKVKSRVVASALGELLSTTERVCVMGHKQPDLDVIGAVAGVCAIARKKGVPVSAVRAPSPYPAEDLTRRLMGLAEYRGVFLPPDEIRHLAGPNCLVVVVDTNRPEQTQLPELLHCGARVVVIDHHRRAASYIQDPALSFQDPYASSASELVAELDQNLLDPGDLIRPEAEALLAGMVLDTKSFTMRTGTRTFEIAAYLKKCGADMAQVNKLFQSDLDETVARFDIMRSAREFRHGIAIATTERPVGRVVAGQAADGLLTIAGIEASCVLFPEPGQTCLSARSSGPINMQVLTEMLGGGGNAATAGAQFPGKTPEEVLPLLEQAIDRYLAEEKEG